MSSWKSTAGRNLWRRTSHAGTAPNTPASWAGAGAVILQDVEEKREALGVLMKTQTGRKFEIDEKMASAVTVVRIDVDSCTAKERTR